MQKGTFLEWDILYTGEGGDFFEGKCKSNGHLHHNLHPNDDDDDGDDDGDGILGLILIGVGWGGECINKNTL